MNSDPAIILLELVCDIVLLNLVFLWRSFAIILTSGIISVINNFFISMSFLISMYVSLTYSIILVSSVQYSDLTILYITLC